MLGSKELEELKNGIWQLDCPKMQLRKKADSGEDVYCGGGYIRRNAEGDLNFKLYSDRVVEVSHIFETNRLKYGELIPDEEYYELVVTDGKGRRWESKQILASTGGCVGRKGAVSSGMLDEVRHTSEKNSGVARRGSSLSIRFFEDFEIPANVSTRVEKSVGGQPRGMTSSMNVARFRSCGYDFEISRRDEMVTLRVKNSSGKLPEQMGVRAVEALEFVLARLLEWAVLEKSEEGVETVRIKRGRASLSKWRLGPPLRFATSDPSGAVWDLYDTYLEHILGYAKVDKYHPLSAFLRRAIQGSGASIETEALEIGVMVEGILRTEFAEFGVMTKAEAEDLENVRRMIEESEIGEKVKKRIAGAINSWKEASATDRLLCLTEAGVVDAAEYDAWKKLRHPSSHGTVPKLKDLQEFVDLCHTGTVLLYKLIFQAIGYKGKYTDYSTRDWPLKYYPKGKGYSGNDTPGASSSEE